MDSPTLRPLLPILVFLSLMTGSFPVLVVPGSEAARSQNDTATEILREITVTVVRPHGFRLADDSQLRTERLPLRTCCGNPRYGKPVALSEGHCLHNGLCAPLLI